MKSVIIVATLVISATALRADDPVPRIERLSNGLRVAIVEDHALPLVSVQLWYRVGSADDALKQPGLCHVTRTILEHRDDAALKLRAAGVRFESKTLRDACYFSSLLPPNFLEYVLDIEAQRMQPLEVTAEMVKTALDAAARDYGLEPDDPEKLAERRLLAAMFPDHPYQHPPGFFAESLKRLQPIDAQEFLDRWFVPGNATLFIIGDVSTVQALELARERFGKLPWRESPRRADVKPPTTKTVRISTTTPNRTGLDIAWLTLPMGYYENAALDVLMHRLCNPVDGPLCERLLSLGCPPPRWHRAAWRHGGLLVLSIDLPPNDREGEAPAEPSSLERIVVEELAKATGKLPTEIEHNRARALAMRDIRNTRATFGGRAYTLATHEIIAGDLLLADLALPRLDRVAVADVQQAALALQDTQTVVAAARKQSTESTRPNATARAGREHHSPPPVEPPPASSKVTTRKLANGVSITFRRVRRRELAEVRTLLRADGCLSDAPGVLMAVGSRRRSVDQVRDYLSYHGLDLFPFMEASPPGLRSRGPATHLAQMVELQAELIRHPNRSETARRTGAGRIREFLQSHRAAAASIEPETYLPPGLIAWVPAMTGLQTADWHETLRQLELVQVVEVLVVADAEPERVIEAVEQAWSDWSPRPAAKP